MEIDREAPVSAAKEIVISAPIDVVWGILTSFDEMARWFTEGRSVTIDGPVAPGARLTMKSTSPGTIKAIIRSVDAPSELAWTGQVMGIAAIHTWQLEPHDDGTRVRTEESMDGIPVRLMKRMMRSRLEGTLETWLRDLKREAEQPSA